jgi:3-oxoadipate enol-lactonase
MASVKANGIELYYESHGEGQVIVFAHGVGGNHASWYQQVAFFARRYRVITFDHRGFGNSTDDPEGPGRAAFVDDLEALLDSLEIRDAALVAQSMGGWTMLGFTLRHPERVKALVMADTLGGITEPGPMADQLAEIAAATRDMPQLERVLSRSFPDRDPAKAELYLQLASFNRADRFNLRGSSGQAPRPSQVAELDVPILFLAGDEDVLVPPQILKQVQKAIPKSGLEFVPGAGHSVYFEAPDSFNQSVLRFLEGVGFAGRGGEVAAGKAG